MKAAPKRPASPKPPSKLALIGGPTRAVPPPPQLHVDCRAPPNVDDMQAQVDTLQEVCALLLRLFPVKTRRDVLGELEVWAEAHWEEPERCAIMLDTLSDLHNAAGCPRPRTR